MRDLIFVSLENWDEIWRRNQFVCAELARRFPKRRILFVGKSLFLPHLARHAKSSAGRKTIQATLSRRFWTVPGLPNIHVFNPIKPFPNPLPGGRFCNENYVASQIRAAARRAHIRDPLLWMNPYDAGFLIGQLRERDLVYDITDDWELAAPTPTERERITTLDRELCRRADLTIVCSQALYESRSGIARNLLLLPNGVDATHYAHISDFDQRTPGLFDESGVFHPQNPAAPAQTTVEPNTAKSNLEETIPTNVVSKPNPIPDWPRPVFGYTGTLHCERIDVDLVVQLARAYPTGSVVLIGPHSWPNGTLPQELADEPNVYAPGPVPYARIPEVMARFDVCIVPHCRSKFVESLNPIKLWEYLASGKPIVSTDVAGFRDFPQLVRLARDARGFIDACQQALGEVNETTHTAPTQNGEKYNAAALFKERRTQAADHSWTARVDALLQELSSCRLIGEQKHKNSHQIGENGQTNASDHNTNGQSSSNFSAADQSVSNEITA